MIPPYFPQENPYTCSLAVLRMVLAYHNIRVSEKELVEQVRKDYGKNFKNIWNTTITRLSCQYGIKTTIFAAWPLLQKKICSRALLEFKTNPKTLSYKKYEHPKYKDEVTESFSLAYKEMFRTLELGGRGVYGKLTGNRLKSFLFQNCLIQTSVKLHLLYPGKKHTLHSILIYKLVGETVFFHDPSWGEGLKCDLKKLTKSLDNIGAAIIYHHLS